MGQEGRQGLDGMACPTVSGDGRTPVAGAELNDWGLDQLGLEGPLPRGFLHAYVWYLCGDSWKERGGEDN